MENPKPPYQLHDSTGHWIARLFGAMREEFGRVLTSNGATISDWAVLAAIHSGASIPSEIAKMAAVDRAIASRTLDKLEKQGHIERSRERVNQRSITVTATASGKKLTQSLLAENHRIQERYYAGFTKKELTTFRETLKRMLDNGTANE